MVVWRLRLMVVDHTISGAPIKTFQILRRNNPTTRIILGISLVCLKVEMATQTSLWRIKWAREVSTLTGRVGIPNM